jgi:hypothetical protein
MIGLTLLAALTQNPSLPQRDSTSVVAIYSHITDDSVPQGTGFFTSSGGEVLTAYHVVKGARLLRLYYNKQELSVRIKAISPDWDLAFLEVQPPVPEHTYLPLAPPEALVSEHLRVVGWPRGGEKSVLPGERISGGLSNSLSLRAANGERIFARRIEVLLLNVSAYGGMSGAPVISNQGVVGVLSGSYAEGGGIAWAIPAHYAQAAPTAVLDSPASTVQWPSFDLVIPDVPWNGLRGLYRHDDAAARGFKEFGQALHEAETRLREYGEFYHSKVEASFDTLHKYDSLLAELLVAAEASKSEEKPLRRFLSRDYYDAMQTAAPLMEIMHKATAALDSALSRADAAEKQLLQAAANMVQDPEIKSDFRSGYDTAMQGLAVADSAQTDLDTVLDRFTRNNEEGESLWTEMYKNVDSRDRLDLKTIRRYLRNSQMLFGSEEGGPLTSRIVNVAVHLRRTRYEMLRRLQESMVYQTRINYSGGY